MNFEEIEKIATNHQYINGYRGENLGIRFFNSEGLELAYKFWGLPPVIFETPRKWK